MIWLTGDTHGDVPTIPIHTVRQQDEDAEKYLIILGDFGFVWDDPMSPALEYLNNQGMTILFIDGNHENFDYLNTYPTKSWHGGQVGVLKPNVMHLKRGQVYDIMGHTVFTMGGGNSIDKAERVPHKSWWEAEEISTKNLEEAEKNLKACSYEVDYVLTHAIPTAYLSWVNPEFKPDACTERLEWLRNRINYKHWYCGHYHTNRSCDRHTILYKNVLKLGDVICR